MGFGFWVSALWGRHRSRFFVGVRGYFWFVGFCCWYVMIVVESFLLLRKCWGSED